MITEPHHHRRLMAGRDTLEKHRASTPLELLFDLTFIVSFGIAGSEFSHIFAEGHYAAALIGFTFASFAICWAWINFSWFASAYDTDDWIFRVTTMVQMVGVLILALSLPRMYRSVEHGAHLDIGVMVLGYVVMRIAMVFQWLRAARQDPARRRACLTYAAAIAAVQVGWVALAILHLPLTMMLVIVALLVLAELAGPAIAERRDGGTPWHAHHIAERYSLFAIIALGEGIFGTAATLSAVTEGNGWTLDAALVCVAGVGLTFGMWWIYYILPAAQILQTHRERAFVWGYSQILIVAAIVATGAGLHVAAYFIEGKAHIGALAVVLSVAAPVGLFVGLIYALYAYMVQSFDRFHIALLGLTAAVMAVAVLAAMAGIGVTACLIILMLAPAVTVIGYELKGHRHQAGILANT